GALASQLLGTGGIDNQGLAGLEQDLNSKHAGRDGQQRIVKDARGDPVSVKQLRGESAGEDIRLTLNAPLQARTESVLSDVGRIYQPQGAPAIAMDPDTGDILAVANWREVNADRAEEPHALARRTP